MPLSDVVRILNSHSHSHLVGIQSSMPLVAAEGRVFVHYANLRLESCFVPYIDAGEGTLLGHVAQLRTVGQGSGQELEPGAVFALPTDAEELIYLDRLVRTLHTLNYLTRPDRGQLLLKVHPRHVASIPTGHGLAFEEILRPCGLLPEQIILELDAGEETDRDHLKLAIANYQARGYGVAIGRFGTGSLDFGFLKDTRPTIVRLDGALLASGRPLHRLVDGLRDLGIRVLADSPGISGRHRGDLPSFDLLQFQDRRRLLHADLRIAGAPRKRGRTYTSLAGLP